MTIRISLPISFAVAGLLAGQGAFGATLYVDGNLGGTCNGSYNPSARSCSGGSATAYSSLSAGLSAVGAGDTLYLRAGTYGQLDIQNSGTINQPVVIEGYQNETVTITSGSVAIWVINRSNVTIRNLRVTNSEGFGRLEGSTNITIDNIDFSNAGASGTTGALKLVRSTYNRILNSSFDNGSDLFLLQDDSDYNLVQGNTFGSAAHSLISIRCASFNVIRDNELNNPDQKAMELFDCEGVSDAPVRYDDARRNLIENNRFYGTADSYKSNDYNAIQHGGQETIVRLNVFTRNLGGGVNFQYYSDESEYVYENRLFNNTFYNNECFAIIGDSGPNSQYYDNRAKNNLLYANRNCDGGGSQQVEIPDSGRVILESNALVSSDPGFVSAASLNLNLLPSSAQIDAGDFATATVSAGSGTQIPVADAGYFYDGYGIVGEFGDVIRIEGSTETARIVSIDYSTNVLQVDRSLAWQSGSGVHLNYSGNAPDMGAFEANLVRPNPPTALVVD